MVGCATVRLSLKLVVELELILSLLHSDKGSFAFNGFFVFLEGANIPNISIVYLKRHLAVEEKNQ